MDPHSKKALKVTLAVSPLFTLPLLTALIYSWHNDLDFFAIILLIIMINVACLLIAAVIEKYSVKRSEEALAKKKMRMFALLPAYFPMLGAILTRISENLCLFLSLSVSASVIAYIAMIAMAYSKANKEEYGDVSIAGQVILAIRFIFSSAVIYGVSLSVTYMGEWSKIKELF